MNKKEVLELKRRFKKEQASFTRLAGCYVDGNRQKVCQFNGPFLTVEDDVFFKYLEIAGKVLSGTLGNNLLDLEFPLSEELPGGRQQILMALRECRFENEDLLNTWYDLVIENYHETGNYLILLYLDSYDVPMRAKDELNIGESVEIYTYMIAAICPVVLSKPGLGYIEAENTIGARMRDWVVGVPSTGFLFPGFNQRSADIHEALFYTKDPKNPHTEFIENVLGCGSVMTHTEQKIAFSSILKGVVGEGTEESETKMLSVEQALQDIHLEYEEAYADTETEPLPLDKNVLERALQESRVSSEEAIKITSLVEDTFGDSKPDTASVIDTKALEKGALKLENHDLTVELAQKTLEAEHLRKELEETSELRLRPFKNKDAETIVSWLTDERMFSLWASDQYDHYPITAEEMIAKYRETEDTDNFYPMTAFDDQGMVGHLIFRYVDERKREVRLGFIIVNNERRGEGLGKAMVSKACKFAKQYLGAKKLSLGVFEENKAARACYEACGFKENTAEEPRFVHLLGEDRKCIPMIQ